MERVGDRYEKMEGYGSTGQSPQRAVVPMEKEKMIGPSSGETTVFLRHLVLVIPCG
jgi:hypothetical protein